MSQVKLSICIATFNRASYIGATLDSLIEQLTDDVEIVVLDGGSADRTEDVVRERASTCSGLRYLRQQTNQGVDRDFDAAVSAASGEYAWLMSDDDLLRPGAIRAVLEALRNEYSLVIVNAAVRSKDLSRVLEPRRLRFDSDRVYGPGEMDRLFVETGPYLTFIGAVVIRRDLWLQRHRESYYGSCFIHVGVIFQQALPRDSLVIAEPFISIRYGNAMWRPKEFEIWMFKWPGLIRSLPGLSESAKRAGCDLAPWRNPKTLLMFRARGTYSITEYRHWVRPQLASLKHRLSAVLIALVPGSLVNALGLLYYALIRRGRGMEIVDLKNSRYYFGNWS